MRFGEVEVDRKAALIGGRRRAREETAQQRARRSRPLHCIDPPSLRRVDSLGEAKVFNKLRRTLHDLSSIFLVGKSIWRGFTENQPIYSRSRFVKWLMVIG